MRLSLRLAFMLVGAILLTGCSHVQIRGQADRGRQEVPVYGLMSVGQEFVSSDRNLARIDVFLSTTRSGRVSGKKARLALIELPDRRPAAAVELPLAEITEAGLYDFRFGPLSDSRSKRYYLELTAPALSEEEAVFVGMAAADKYPDGTAYIGGRPVPEADLQFLPFIAMDTRMVFNSSASRLIADLPFLIFWFICLAGAAALTVFSLRGPSERRNDNL